MTWTSWTCFKSTYCFCSKKRTSSCLCVLFEWPKSVFQDSHWGLSLAGCQGQVCGREQQTVRERATWHELAFCVNASITGTGRRTYQQRLTPPNIFPWPIPIQSHTLYATPLLYPPSLPHRFEKATAFAKTADASAKECRRRSVFFAVGHEAVSKET